MPPIYNKNRISISQPSLALAFFFVINCSSSIAAQHEHQYDISQTTTSAINSPVVSTITFIDTNATATTTTYVNLSTSTAKTFNKKKSSLPAEEPPIDVKADFIEYDTINRIILARGKADIKQLDQRITADEIEIHLDEEIMHISGGARIEKGGDVVYFSSGTFYKKPDYPAAKIGTSSATWITEGEVIEVKGFAQSWIFSAEKVNISKDKYIAHGNGRFTTCQSPNPHYTITTSRLTISPGKFVSAVNAVFWIGKIPVFYLPYWWKGIGPGKLNVIVEPGYNSPDGFFAKTIISYDYSNYSYTKILYDYFSKRGNGVGIDSIYYKPGRAKASVYMYRIREDTTKMERWSAKSLLWASIYDKWSAYSEINYMSDESFNESYFGESWKPVEREITSNLFFNRQSTSSAFAIGVSHKQTYDSVTRSYRQTLLNLPQISYTRYRGNKYLGFYPEYSLSYMRTTVGENNPFYQKFSGNISATSQQVLRKGIVLSPYFSLEESYGENLLFEWILNGKYTIGSGLRFALGRYSYLHFNRIYTQSFIPRTLTPDPQGREIDALGATLFILPFDNTTWKITSGYDYITHRYSSLLNNLTFSKKGDSVMINHSWSIEKSKYENLLIVFSHSYWLNVSAYHNAAYPDLLSMGFSTEIPIGKDKITYQMNGNLEKNIFKPLAQHIRYDKNLHCWDAWVTLRRREPEDRPPIDEIYFNIGIKFEDISGKRKKELEKEFYPWRD